MSNIYVLKDGTTNAIISVHDVEANAEQLKANMLLTGEYRSISLNPYVLNTDKINKLAVVNITGRVYDGDVTMVKITASNPSGVVTDNLQFAVASSVVTFTGQMNLTADELLITDSATLLATLTPRVKTWVESGFARRLTNDK